MEETDDRGRKTRTTEARDKRRGIPQGSPLSPLLANLYMRRFVLGWKMLGLERTLGTRLITYADDLVILCRRGKAEAALQSLREIMGKLKLDTSKYRVSCGTIAPEGREAVTDRCRSQLGGVDLRREDRSAASSDRLACSGRGGSG